MQAASCPAAFGGVSHGRRPSLINSNKHGRGLRFSGISVPGPGYASGPQTPDILPGVGGVGASSVGAVHPPVPFGAWHPTTAWTAGRMGDAAQMQQQWADNEANATSALQWKPTSSGGQGKVSFSSALESITGVLTQVAPIVFGPKPRPQTAAEVVGGGGRPAPVPGWVWAAGAAATVVVVLGVGSVILKKRRKNPRRR